TDFWPENTGGSTEKAQKPARRFRLRGTPLKFSSAPERNVLMEERARQPPGKPVSSLLELLRLGQPANGIFAAGILFSLIEAASGLVVPLLTKQLVDVITASGWSLLPVLWLVATFLLQTASGGLSHYLMAYIGEGFVRNIREHLWNHILGLPIPYFDKHQSGETMSR